MFAIPVGLTTVLIAAVSAIAGAGGAPSDVARTEIPPLYLAAYMQAASTCPGLPWPVLAAIGSIESGHGTSGGATTAADGTVSPPIVGIALDGSGGTAAIRVPAGGSPWHNDPTWDHAVGPMQFITSTWAAWGVDANWRRGGQPAQRLRRHPHRGALPVRTGRSGHEHRRCDLGLQPERRTARPSWPRRRRTARLLPAS